MLERATSKSLLHTGLLSLQVTTIVGVDITKEGLRRPRKADEDIRLIRTTTRFNRELRKLEGGLSDVSASAREKQRFDEDGESERK